MTNIGAPADLAQSLAVLPLTAAAVPAAEPDFTELFRQHQLGLLRLAYLLAGDHHRAEEAVAEVFAKTLPRWRRGRVDDPGPYLRRAVVNEVRKRGRRLGLERRHAAHAAGATTTAAGRRFEDQSVERDELIAALQRLPMQQRAAVVLRFFDDRSEAETARLLGVSAGTVKTHVHRGLTRLRALLEDRR